MINEIQSGKSIIHTKYQESLTTNNDSVSTSGDKKFETWLLEVELFSCLNELIAEIPEIKFYEDSKLLRIFRGVYEKRKKVGKHELEPEEAEKIIERILSEFNKKRKNMSAEQWYNFRKKTEMLYDLGRSGKDQFEKNMPKKVFTSQELNEILKNDDVIMATLIMFELDDYELTFDLAKTLAMLGVFNLGSNKLPYDIPDFIGLSKEDKEYLYNMSEQINKARNFGHDRLSLQDEIEDHFKQKKISKNS